MTLMRFKRRLMLALLCLIGATVYAQSPSEGVTLSLNKTGEGIPFYLPNEQITITLSSAYTGHVYLFEINAQGVAQLIVPVIPQAAPEIMAGSSLHLPSSDYALYASSLVGRNRFVGIVSATPLSGAQLQSLTTLEHLTSLPESTTGEVTFDILTDPSRANAVATAKTLIQIGSVPVNTSYYDLYDPNVVGQATEETNYADAYIGPGSTSPPGSHSVASGTAGKGLTGVPGYCSDPRYASYTECSAGVVSAGADTYVGSTTPAPTSASSVPYYCSDPQYSSYAECGGSSSTSSSASSAPQYCSNALYSSYPECGGTTSPSATYPSTTSPSANSAPQYCSNPQYSSYAECGGTGTHAAIPTTPVSTPPTINYPSSYNVSYPNTTTTPAPATTTPAPATSPSAYTHYCQDPQYSGYADCTGNTSTPVSTPSRPEYCSDPRYGSYAECGGISTPPAPATPSAPVASAGGGYTHYCQDPQYSGYADCTGASVSAPAPTPAPAPAPAPAPTPAPSAPVVSAPAPSSGGYTHYCQDPQYSGYADCTGASASAPTPAPTPTPSTPVVSAPTPSSGGYSHYCQDPRYSGYADCTGTSASAPAPTPPAPTPAPTPSTPVVSAPAPSSGGYSHYCQDPRYSGYADCTGTSASAPAPTPAPTPAPAPSTPVVSAPPSSGGYSHYCQDPRYSGYADCTGTSASAPASPPTPAPAPSTPVVSAPAPSSGGYSHYCQDPRYSGYADCAGTSASAPAPTTPAPTPAPTPSTPVASAPAPSSGGYPYYCQDPQYSNYPACNPSQTTTSPPASPPPPIDYTQSQASAPATSTGPGPSSNYNVATYGTSGGISTNPSYVLPSPRAGASTPAASGPSPSTERALQVTPASTPAPTPAPAQTSAPRTTATTGSLIISTNVPGADVYLNNQPRGKVPNTLQMRLDNLPAGQHTLLISAPGYQTYSQTVLINSGYAQTVSASLQPVQATAPTTSTPTPTATATTAMPTATTTTTPVQTSALGYLSVSTPYSGVQVYVDGVYQGTTPLQTPLRLSEKNYNVTIKRVGMADQKQSVQVLANRTYTLNVP